MAIRENLLETIFEGVPEDRVQHLDEILSREEFGESAENDAPTKALREAKIELNRAEWKIGLEQLRKATRLKLGNAGEL